MGENGMGLKEFFVAVGGDCAAVLDRLPSEDMVVRFLRKFPRDTSYENLRLALDNGDIETAFRSVHTLKGVAANLGLDSLAAAASELTEALRNADTLPPVQLVDAVGELYQTAIAGIDMLDYGA